MNYDPLRLQNAMGERNLTNFVSTRDTAERDEGDADVSCLSTQIATTLRLGHFRNKTIVTVVLILTR